MRFMLRSVVFSFSFLSSFASQAGFEVLSLPPNGEVYFHTQAYGVSGDGRVVVGSGTYVFAGGEFVSPGPESAYRWDGGVPTSLEPIVPEHERSIALAASLDGRVVTGAIYRGAPHPSNGFVWANGSFSPLGDLPGGSAWSRGQDVSADGSVIAGLSVDGVTDRAIRWIAGVMTNLGVGTRWSTAEAISGDGSILAGYQQFDGAMRWENGVGTILTPPPGDFATKAFGISADGSTILGQSLQSHGEEAVRWVDGVPQLLGTLPGHTRSAALDASRHGAIVAGYSSGADGRRTAVVWDAQNGMRSLHALLLSMGDPVGGWSLREAHAISDQGDVVVGIGVNPSGLERGFIARIDASDPIAAPEPGLGLALGSGALLLATIGLRRTRG